MRASRSVRCASREIVTPAWKPNSVFIEKGRIVKSKGSSCLWAVGIAVILGSATLAGCGSGGSGGSTTQANSKGLTQVKMAVLPVLLSVPVYTAQDKGFFKKHGLEVTTTPVANAAAAVPLVLSGQVDFGLGAASAFAVARSNGVPVKEIVGTDAMPSDNSKSPIALMVKKGSSIKTASDVEGKRVAIPALKAAPELSVREWMKANGADSSSVKFVQLDFEAALTALDHGDVDVSFMFEPFIAKSKLGDQQVLAYPNPPGMTDGVVIASEQYLSKNADVAGRVKKAIAEADQYAHDNPDYVRTLIGKQLNVPDNLLKEMNVGDYKGEINVDILTSQIKDMQSYGWLKTNVDLKDLIWSEGK